MFLIYLWVYTFFNRIREEEMYMPLSMHQLGLKLCTQNGLSGTKMRACISSKDSKDVLVPHTKAENSQNSSKKKKLS